MSKSFDIVVIGSGIAGSALALALQQAGLQTLCIERKSHPRFAIGESLVPTTSFLLKQLARDYQIPELGQIAHYLGLRAHGCAAWPKQAFWHACHLEGEPLAPNREHFLEGLHLPIGPDVHMLRADADAFLVSLFPKYGVQYQENTEMVGFEAGHAGVMLRLRGPGGESGVRARMVVDASGHASFLAHQFGLRDAVPRLATDTRSIFSHFQNVPPLDEQLGGCHESFRFRRDGATMHHQFRGGWIWVIPFDNGITSVGVQLDRRIHPLDERISPEDEIAALLDRYPGIAAHLGAMEAIRPIVRTDRVQFTSRSILGNGFILTPHAAGFVEPLYSTGILVTALFISRFVPAAQEALATGNWQREQFLPIERCFFDELKQIDYVVNGTIQSFRNPELFKQYWRLWIIGVLANLADLVLVGRAPRHRPNSLGASVPGLTAHVARMHAAMAECRSDEDDLALAERMYRESEPWWERIAAPLVCCDHREPNAAGGTNVYAVRSIERNLEWLEKMLNDPEVAQPDMSAKHANRWLLQAAVEHTEQLERYRSSRAEGTDYHRAYERILRQHNPARFDYFAEVGLLP
jgi:FADH2 O2-dependent halogenase